MLNKELQTKINKEVGRSTAFTFIYYPDQAFDSNFLFEFLDSIKVPSCVSPLHDQDVNETNTSTGEVEFKKPHYHVVIDFGSGQNKTVEQMFELISPIRSNVSITPWDSPIFQDKIDQNKFDNLKKLWKSENIVRNMRTLLRYFKHLDNPEKHQYIESCDEYHTFCGFELEDRIYSQTDSYRLLDEIFDFIDNNQVYSFCDLVRYTRKNNREWYTVICRNQFTQIILYYIKSFTYQDTGALDRKVEEMESGN